MNTIPNLPNPTPEEAKLEARRAQARKDYKAFSGVKMAFYPRTPRGTKTKDELRIAHNERRRDLHSERIEARELAGILPRKRGPGKIYDTPADKERARNARRKLVLDAAKPAPVAKPERPALVTAIRIVAAAKPEPVARPVPACRRAKPKAAKVPKVFKSTDGQVRCFVTYPSNSKGYGDLFIDADKVDATRAKYLALGGTFHTSKM